MPTNKLANESEFIGWYQEGKTYSWIIDEYERKYGIEIGLGTISNWRHRLGPKKRAVRDPALIPWAVKREHRHNYLIQMLRTEGRRRAGESVPADRLKKLESFLESLKESDAVVHYDPNTEQGWWLVPRRPGIDEDLIRAPEEITRQRGARE